MADLIPQTFHLEFPIALAIHERAAKEGVSPSEVVADALRKALTVEVQAAAGVRPLATVIQQVVRDKGKESPRGGDTTSHYSPPE